MGGCCIGDLPIIRHLPFMCSCDTSCFLDSGCSYHPSRNTNAESTRNIANELAEMKKNKRVTSEKIETDIISCMTAITNEFIQLLEIENTKDFGGKSLNINIEELRRTNETLKNEIKGSIADYIDNNLVMTDPELSAIMKENDDDKRGKKFDNFVSKLNKQAVKQLKEKIEISIENQNSQIKEIIQTRLTEVQNSMDEAQKTLNAILNSDDDEKEKTKIEQEYKMGVNVLLQSELKK